MVAYTFYESDNRVRRYAEALAKRGDRVEAIALRREGQPGYEVISGVHVHRIQTRRRDEKSPASYLRKLLLFFFRSAWLITRLHMRSRYDLIHVHSVPDFEVFATLVPRLMGARVILDIHDVVPEFYAAKFKTGSASPAFRALVALERLSAGYANHVIISNHLWQEKLLARRSVSADKCTTIINFPDLTIFKRRAETVPENASIRMCYPGTLNWHQGVDLAISAMARVCDAAPDLKFVIVGDGPERENIKALIASRRLEDRVSFTGTVPIEKVAETMANIELGIVPKRADSFGDEAFSTKIPEFMAMGVPVVASRTRIDQFYFTNQMVQYFESDNVDDLSAKILELIRDPTRRRALVESADQWVRENNWNVKKDEYLLLVDRLLEVSSKSSASISAICEK